MEDLEIENSIKNNLNIEEEQKSFIETKLGNIINKGINIGIKYILPDLIEDEIIEIKDTMIQNGLSEGIKKTIESAINIGKSAIGIVTGNFENINQVQTAIKKGGIIDSVSEVIDTVVNKSIENGKITSSIGNTIYKGKNTILNTISNNIENEFQSQLDSIEKLEKYNNNWKKYYENKDFDGMQREYKKIQEKLKNVIPIENTINNSREISNIHNLIKNNGKNFNLSVEELELAKSL